jgi:hypothetical protein
MISLKNFENWKGDGTSDEIFLEQHPCDSTLVVFYSLNNREGFVAWICYGSTTKHH